MVETKKKVNLNQVKKESLRKRKDSSHAGGRHGTFRQSSQEERKTMMGRREGKK